MPTTTALKSCQRCGDQVFWVHIEGESERKSFPMDPNPMSPHPVGWNHNVETYDGYFIEAWTEYGMFDEDGSQPTSTVVKQLTKKNLDPELPIWRSHLTTCRNLTS